MTPIPDKQRIEHARQAWRKTEPFLEKLSKTEHGKIISGQHLAVGELLSFIDASII